MIQEQDDLRMICWLLELRTVVELHQRAPAKAARSIQTLLSVVHAIENQPTFVSTLTTNKYQQAAYRLSAELCSDPGVSNDTLVQLQRSLESQDLLAQARWGFASERAFCIELFLRYPPAPPYWNERNQYLDAMEELDVMCDDGWPSLVEMSRTGTEPGRFGPLTTMARDAWLRSLPSIARIETLRRLTIVALAARRFVNDSHRLPESISDLVPTYLATVPKDILEKEPVSISATDDIMTISSYAPSKGDETDSDSKSTTMSLQVHLPPTVAH